MSEHLPDGTCPDGKRCHASRGAARRFGGHVRGINGVRHRAYLCDRCGCWHLTTSATPAPLRGHRRRGAPPPPPVATRAELDAWWAEHGGAP